MRLPSFAFREKLSAIILNVANILFIGVNYDKQNKNTG